MITYITQYKTPLMDSWAYTKRTPVYDNALASLKYWLDFIPENTPEPKIKARILESKIYEDIPVVKIIYEENNYERYD